MCGVSQTENLINLFWENGGQLTLAQILRRYDLIGSKYTGRISDARKVLMAQGKTIICKENRDYPTETIYTIQNIEPKEGQFEMFQTRAA